MPRGFLKTLNSWAFTRSKNHGRYWWRLCRNWIIGGCMANLLCLIAVLLCSLWPSFVQAYPASASSGYEYASNVSGLAGTAAYYPDPAGACAADAARNTNTFPVGTKTGTVSGSAPSYICTISSIGFGYIGRRAATVVYSCPGGGSLSGTTCVCTAPAVDNGTSCSDPNIAKCAAAAGGSDLYGGFTSFAGVGTSFCPTDGLSSCASKVTGGFATVKNGARSWTIEVEYSGGTCAPPSSGEPGVETDCKGTVGTVNGVTVCSPPSDRNTVESIKSTTATNPVSAASAPGSGGSTTTEEATKCTGSKCSTTTTTTTTPAGGGAATVTVKTEDVPKDDYCRDNPRAIMCLTSSFGGACSGGFVCEGDAVQCATAREIHTRNCRMFDQDSPESLLYGTEKNKAGSQVSNENVAISSANFDTSDALGGGACITDKVVTVMGSPITIPFSGVCVHLAMLGNVLLTVSFLLAGRIFMRG